ncbi:hypothetical protein HPP92_025623 [Vanilla planifolia]|uniref:Uncharacterized protein n=1 Tax=Vanilla planifolia TaxID=51239 RepID=A0A835PGY7_VANPL|nr:hypothetical protein HPP92_025623 [Vanilla planifolia]
MPWGLSLSCLSAWLCVARTFTSLMSSFPRTSRTSIQGGKLFNAKRSVVRVADVDPNFKIALLVSKQEHCLVDILHGWQDGRLVDINCVISNHDRAPNTHVIRFLETRDSILLSSYLSRK